MTAASTPERVKGVELVDSEGLAAPLRLTRICTVEGRTYYRVESDRDAFEFYTTPKGLIRGLDYAARP